MATVGNAFASRANELEKHGWQFIDTNGNGITARDVLRSSGGPSPVLKIAAPAKAGHFALSFGFKALSKTSSVYIVSLWQGQKFEQNVDSLAVNMATTLKPEQIDLSLGRAISSLADEAKMNSRSARRESPGIIKSIVNLLLPSAEAQETNGSNGGCMVEAGKTLAIVAILGTGFLVYKWVQNTGNATVRSALKQADDFAGWIVWIVGFTLAWRGYSVAMDACFN